MKTVKKAVAKEKEPKISVNKLAEYHQANATRRRQIIKALKEDSEFRKNYYFEVRNALPGYFKNDYDNRRLDTLIARIEAKKGTTEWDERDNPNSILALKSLKKIDLPDLSEYDIVTDLDKVNLIEMGGVNVSIKPEIYLRHRKTGRIGGIKTHIAKTKANQLDSTGLENAAVIMKHGFMQYGYSEKEIDNRACIIIDVFQETYGTAPRAFKRSLDSLTACCEEIAARWPTL